MKLTKEILKNATIVDVRTHGEVALGAVEGSIHIPLDELFSELDRLKLEKPPYVLYCRTGNRSGHAVEFLQEEGFEDVYNGINQAYIEDLLA